MISPPRGVIGGTEYTKYAEFLKYYFLLPHVKNNAWLKCPFIKIVKSMANKAGI